jgi:transcriptional regulator GlxA family with amidase domain
MPDERIVDNGHILTAAGVSAGIDLALHLVGRLLGDEQAEMAQLLIEYDPRPPYDAGHMSKAGKALALKARLKMNRIAAANPRNLLSVPKILLESWTRSRRRGRR